MENVFDLFGDRNPDYLIDDAGDHSPTVYRINDLDQELADFVIANIIALPSLTDLDLYRLMPGYPNPRMLQAWLHKHVAFKAAYDVAIVHRKIYTTYSTFIADAVCDLVAQSQHSLQELATKHLSWFPSQRAIRQWLSEEPTFRESYATARSLQGDYIAFQAMSILDSTDATGGKDSASAVLKDRERATHRRWMATALAPRYWGAKTDIVTTDQPQSFAELIQKLDDENNVPGMPETKTIKESA